MAIEETERREMGDPVCQEDAIRPSGSGQEHASRSVERLLLGLLLIGIFYTLYFAKAIILPVLLALLLTAILQPIVRYMRRLRVPESVGSALTVLFLVGLLVTGVYELSDPAAKWLDEGPVVLNQLRYKLYPLQKSIKDAQETTAKIKEMTDTQEKEERVVVKGPTLAHQAFGYAKSFTLTALIVLLLIYFFLGFGNDWIRRISPDPGYTQDRPKWLTYLVDIGRQISIYIQTLSLINLGLGIATAVLMAILGMPNPILWGVLAALLNFIPYLGGMVTTGIIGIISFITFDSWNKILLPPVLFLCLTGMEGLVIQTLTMGKRFSLNPVMIFMSFLTWGWLWGPIGVFLAVPILVAFKTVADREDSLKSIRPLIGKPVLSHPLHQDPPKKERKIRIACT